MDTVNDMVGRINAILWHDWVLYTVLGTGVLFTVWSGFSQYRALTHGTQVIRGRYDDPRDPGVLNHFQALSTALSATVGLGNIGGVALAIALGGPGAVFWMWMVGIFGMALKTTEVTLSMLYRNTDDPDNPHGGPMWVAKEGFRQFGFGAFGTAVGAIFCVTLIISAITGGNMFQAWNVAEITNGYFPTVPKFVVGVILAVAVGLVIIGGIKRIGAVAGRLVPLMCVLYLLAAIYVLAVHYAQIPEMLRLVFVSAFNPTEAGGAFLGGTAGYAFLWGMKRALFSSEAGQGSAPIAHAAARTDEPVREGVVAGLEPFIDTLVVCTLTSLVILLSGAWDRDGEARYDAVPSPINAWELTVVENRIERTIYGVVIEETDTHVGFLNGNPTRGEAAYREWPRRIVGSVAVAEGRWIPDVLTVPEKRPEAREISGPWQRNNTVFMIVRGETDHGTGRDLHRLHGTVREVKDGLMVAWQPYTAEEPPQMEDPWLYNYFVGAFLTGHAFDRVLPGLGMWLVTLACWLFAITTMIAWSYYGEQGVIYLVGERGVLTYKLAYCALIMISTLGFIRTDEQLDEWTALGTGVMLFANIPILLIFGYQAMTAYHGYIRRLRSGQMRSPHAATPITEMVKGRSSK
jgi:alanine or glycine:cation symporter, AGCS family